MPPPPPLQPEQTPNYAGGPVPLWAPYYGAPIGEAVRRFFSKYATFSGRAGRAEFWWWFLVNAIVGIILNILITATGGSMNGSGQMTAGSTVFSIIAGIYGLAVLIPSLALWWRRLHDTDRSGGWFFIGLIPLVGGIILLVFSLLPANPAGARFDKPTS